MPPECKKCFTHHPASDHDVRVAVTQSLRKGERLFMDFPARLRAQGFVIVREIEGTR